MILPERASMPLPSSASKSWFTSPSSGEPRGGIFPLCPRCIKFDIRLWGENVGRASDMKQRRDLNCMFDIIDIFAS